MLRKHKMSLQNIVRIAKSALHKCPEKSSSISCLSRLFYQSCLSVVFLSRGCCQMSSRTLLEKWAIALARKLEVIWPHITSNSNQLGVHALPRPSLWMMNHELLTQSVTGVSIELLGQPKNIKWGFTDGHGKRCKCTYHFFLFEKWAQKTMPRNATNLA